MVILVVTVMLSSVRYPPWLSNLSKTKAAVPVGINEKSLVWLIDAADEIPVDAIARMSILAFIG